MLVTCHRPYYWFNEMARAKPTFLLLKQIFTSSKFEALARQVGHSGTSAGAGEGGGGGKVGFIETAMCWFFQRKVQLEIAEAKEQLVAERGELDRLREQRAAERSAVTAECSAERRRSVKCPSYWELAVFKWKFQH